MRQRLPFPFNLLSAIDSIYYDTSREEDALREWAEVLGLEPHEVNVSEKCRIVLEKGLTPEVCRDFRGIRRWVACRAWDLIENDVVNTWREAMKKAWAEAKAKCAELGVYV